MEAEERARSDDVSELLATILSLAILLSLCRAEVIHFGSLPILAKAGRVALAAYFDYLYVGVITAAFLGLLSLAGRREKTRRVVHLAFLIVAVASLLAALINVKVVPMLGKPLNYQWLYYSDFLRSQDAHNAILSELSWKLLLIGATAIAGLLAMTHVFSRVLKSLVRRFGSRPLLRVALAVLVLYLVAGGHLLSRLHWPAPSLENPVVSFAHSLVVAQRSPRLLTMTTSVGPDDFGPRQPPSPMLSAIAQRNSG